MSTQNWHLSQHSHNKQFADNVLYAFHSTYNDWIITSLFYSAVHLVNAHCFKHGFDIPTNHSNRSRTIEDKLQPIRAEYDSLRLLSETTRYNSHHSKITDLDVLRAKQWFQKIFTYIDSA